MSKLKKKETMIISGIELVIHCANKSNSSMGAVKSGCGYHSERKYSRREKHKEKYCWLLTLVHVSHTNTMIKQCASGNRLLVSII